MSFKNLPMIWKVLSLLLLLGATSLVGVYYATSQFTVIDDLDTAIINGPAAAATDMARANRFMAATGAAIYRAIVETTDEGNRAAEKDLHDSTAGFDAEISAATKATPSFADKINIVSKHYHDALAGPCAETIHIASISETAEGNAKAASLMDKACKPAFDGVLAEIGAFNDELEKVRDKQNGDVTTIVVSSARMTLGGVVVAILMIAGFSAWIVRGSVVAPVGVMIGLTQSLAAGQLDIRVSGTERGDEIGAMAKSLEILRAELQSAEAARVAQSKADEAAKAQIMRRSQLADAFVSQMQKLAGSFGQSSGEVADAAKSLSATAERRRVNPRRLRPQPKRQQRTCRRSPPRPKKWLFPYARFPLRSIIRQRSPIRPSPRRKPRVSGSRYWRRPRRPSAMSSI